MFKKLCLTIFLFLISAPAYAEVLVLANQATATKRRVEFYCVDATDGITAETGEAGGQPQISTNGTAAWTNTGIGTLTAIGNGHYYADLTQAAVATAGNRIFTRYKSANTAECVADFVRVIAVDLDSTTLGLATLAANVLQWNSSNVAAPATAGYPSVTIKDGTGTGEIDTTAGAVAHVVLTDSGGSGASVAAIADGVWDEVLSGHLTAGSTGAQLNSGGGSAPSAATVADAVWDELIAGHVGTGSTGAKLNGLTGSVGVDPLTVAVPGSYAPGTVGYRIGTYIDTRPAVKRGMGKKWIMTFVTANQGNIITTGTPTCQIAKGSAVLINLSTPNPATPLTAQGKSVITLSNADMDSADFVLLRCSVANSRIEEQIFNVEQP